MTLREAYEFGKNELISVGIGDAATDAFTLLEFVTGITRARYFLDMNTALPPEQEARYLEYIEVRKTHIPLQHITGEQEFMGLPFQVNEHVLIPRQDTEVLVEQGLAFAKPGMHVLDMCTGSGCILISMLKLGKDLQGTGVDISKEALQVAATNLKTLGVEAKLIQSNLFEAVTGTYDLIVSNPPYIRTAVIEELEEEVKFHDPFIALDGKEDGLYFYRRIVEESRKFLKPDGWLCFEIGHDQGEDVKSMMGAAGFDHVTIKKDLAGLDRVVYGEYNIVGKK